MPKLPSRAIQTSIGDRFHMRDDERYHPPYHGWAPCLTPDCQQYISLGPVILRSIWINDLCRRDNALFTRLHYSDGERRGPRAKEVLLREIPTANGYFGTWPYTLVEISYEVERGGRIAAHRHPRFSVETIRNGSFTAEFLQTAEELNLAPTRLATIVSLHADPRVEQALLVTPPHLAAHP
ncbi:MAG: hypothetical protein QY323_00280 [Patescibacteria group bacterium]|nr:MAG: hypothetical protein QY323_00280 [Patescibacteria group bacterium]